LVDSVFLASSSREVFDELFDKILAISVPSLLAQQRLRRLAMENWYVEHGGQRLGPMSMEAVRQMAVSGQIAPADLVWCQGMSTWQRADTQSWFNSAIGSAPPPLPAPQWGNLFKGEAYVETEPPSLIGWSIAVLLCCCLPGGIVGLIYGTKAKTEYAKGNYSAAHSAYETGKNWLIGSSIAGVIINIIYIAVKASQQ
jgi:GYF domain 2/Interferon-induced transmembrane protein